MLNIYWNLRAQSLLFVSLLLFLTGYLFSNILIVFAGTIILSLLLYVRRSFEDSIGTVTVERKTLEPLLYVNNTVTMKTCIRSTGSEHYVRINESLDTDAELIMGDLSTFSMISKDHPVELQYQLQFQSRGAHEISGLTIELLDPWKLFSVQQSIPTVSRFHVHSDPNDIHIAKRTKISEDPKLLLPTILGYDLKREYEGIRSYTPGDSSRDIDWKASSRLQALATRLFQKHQAAETTIALDVSRSMRRKSGQKAQIEHGIAITIQLTHLLQSLHHSVGFIAFDEHKIVTSIEPSFSYQEIFQTCSDLPSILPIERYISNVHDTNESSFILDNNEHQSYLSKISPFLTGGKPSVKQSMQLTGIYQAIQSIIHHGRKNHIIIISDIGSNYDAFFRSISLARDQKQSIWLLTMDSPFYHQNSVQMEKEQVEKIYRYQEARRLLFTKLRNKQVDIIELSPNIQTPHIIQSMKRKKG